MAKRKIFVGTSGWIYNDWAGKFYPPDVKGTKRLEYYVTQFPTVEVNATFYRMPSKQMIASWNRRLPENFHMVLKGPRVITHLQKLVDCDEQLRQFLAVVKELKTLKVILWQLPPSLHKDLARLEAFLGQLPDFPRHAVEFRHTSWWQEDVAELLAQYRAAFVAVSHPKLPDTVFPTTDFLYLRFHGLGKQLYRYDYSDEELQHWVDLVRPHLKGRTLYAFFNNDYNAFAPKNAKRFVELLEATSRRKK